MGGALPLVMPGNSPVIRSSGDPVATRSWQEEVSGLRPRPAMCIDAALARTKDKDFIKQEYHPVMLLIAFVMAV